jgi:hypothetical protein
MLAANAVAAAAHAAVVVGPVGEKAVPVEARKHLVVRAAGKADQQRSHDEELLNRHDSRADEECSGNALQMARRVSSSDNCRSLN